MTFHLDFVMAPLCHTSTSRHLNSSNAADTNQQEECANTRKFGRGKTAGLSIAKKKRKSATGKLSVFIPSDKMVAVGPGAADFVTEISIIVQKNAPLNVKKWKDISKDAKDKIVEKVMDTFDIDDSDHNRDVILDTSKRLYRNYRTRLHSHFKKSETNEQALEHKPDTVSDDDWEYLVTYFSSPGFKAMSNRNKSNKAKQVVNHICGRKSFQAVSYDARDPNTEKEPNFQDLWQMTHMKNNGEWVDEASKEVHAKVQEISSGMLQDMPDEVNKDPIINAAFQSIVGERSGYSRGFGAGMKPSKGKFTTGLHQELNNEREKRRDIEVKLKEVESQLIEERNMREEMALRFEESQKQLEEKVERQVEEHLAAIFLRRHGFSAGQSSSPMNVTYGHDNRSGNANRFGTTDDMVAHKSTNLMPMMPITAQGFVQTNFRQED